MIKREIVFIETKDYQSADKRWVLCIDNDNKIFDAYFENGQYWENSGSKADGMSGIKGWCYQ